MSISNYINPAQHWSLNGHLPTLFPPNVTVPSPSSSSPSALSNYLLQQHFLRWPAAAAAAAAAYLFGGGEGNHHGNHGGDRLEQWETYLKEIQLLNDDVVGDQR